MIELMIEGLSHDGRGVGRYDGKAVFVVGALPGDTVQARIIEKQKNFDEAQLLHVVNASLDRVAPFCSLYGECGGCQLQHMSIDAQRYWKSAHFMTALFKAFNPKKCEVADPIIGQDQGYRRRAKLVWGKTKADKSARLGFKAQQSNEIVDVEHCPLLTDSLNQALPEKRQQLLPQASRAVKELVMVDADNGVFSADTPTEAQPYYQISGLKLAFKTDGFIQINADINRKMVAQALDWLDLKPENSVLDLFCGVGNFSLPIAQQVKKVVAIEGLAELVAQARQNAELNALGNIECYQADLFKDVNHFPWFNKQRYDRILLDPGRMGAVDICQHMGALKADKIVYVSCNESTLIRDLKVLKTQGYELRKAGFIDMFPHTMHAEVMVLLVKSAKKPQKKSPGIFKL